MICIYIYLDLRFGKNFCWSCKNPYLPDHRQIWVSSLLRRQNCSSVGRFCFQYHNQNWRERIWNEIPDWGWFNISLAQTSRSCPFFSTCGLSLRKVRPTHSLHSPCQLKLLLPHCTILASDCKVCQCLAQGFGGVDRCNGACSSFRSRCFHHTGRSRTLLRITLKTFFRFFCLRYYLFGFVPPGLANFPDKWYVEVQSVLWPAEKAKELLLFKCWIL